MKIWIFIWRMQPMHLWHQKVIEKSFKENDFTLIFLWSSWIVDKNNPLTDIQRKNIIESIYWYDNNYKVLYLKDKKSDLEWIKDIEKNINNVINFKIDKIIFYWWDFENDYAIKVLKKYKNNFSFDRVFFKEISRKEIIVFENWKQYYISSTLIRNTIINKNYTLLEKLLDFKAYEKIINFIDK